MRDLKAAETPGDSVMLSDADLADALDSSLDLNKDACKTSSSNTTLPTQDVQTTTPTLEEGLELVVSTKRFKCVATLMLAGSRINRCLQERDLRAGDLCNIFDCLVEEKIVTVTVVGSRRERTFHRTDSELFCTLNDRSQKSVVFDETGTLKLQAVHLAGGHEHRRVDFKMYKYMHESADGQIVLLSFNKYRFYCEMVNGVAELKLSEDSDVPDCIAGDKECFLFKKSCSDVSFITFESVSCPGWFISTSDVDKQPLEMCKREERRFTQFSELKSKKQS